MIVGAALCPQPPLLLRELSGTAEVAPELRAACRLAVDQLLATTPELVVVVGPGATTGSWPATARIDTARWLGAPPDAPDEVIGREVASRDVVGHEQRSYPDLPLSLGVGAQLLDEAGCPVPLEFRSFGPDAAADEAADAGRFLAARPERIALLAVGDGSARRGPRAPGHIDGRAVPFDDNVERAFRQGDLAALLEIDPTLSDALLAPGRTAWQALAGAVSGLAVTSDVLYADDPFGVFYLVAIVQPKLAEAMP